jgi:thiol-disulfide isomerase/thioredoxin
MVLTKSTRSFLVFASLCLFCQAYVFAQDASKILYSSKAKCQAVKQGYFEVEKHLKFMLGRDTSIYSVRCYYKRAPADTIYSFIFHSSTSVNGEYKGDAIYTGNDFVLALSKDSSATIRSCALYGQDIKNSRFNYIFFDPLTDRRCFPFVEDSDSIDQTSTVKFTGIEIKNLHACYHVEITRIPAEQRSLSGFRNIQTVYHYWIDTVDFIPKEYVIISRNLVNNDTLQQYERVTLRNFNPDLSFDETLISLKSIPQGYRVKTYAPGNQPPLLPIGIQAPGWSLTAISGEKYDLTSLKGKTVLVDFFYKSCYPCLLSLPGLVSLYEKYKDKGLIIIGINPVDKDREALIKFLAGNKVTYPVFMEGKNVSQDYHVSLYPTLYLIDKTGKIKFSQTGFGEGMGKDLEKIVEETL